MLDDVQRDPVDASLRLGEVLGLGVALLDLSFLRVGLIRKDAVKEPIECLPL